jgi:hypothetical protein
MVLVLSIPQLIIPASTTVTITTHLAYNPNVNNGTNNDGGTSNTGNIGGIGTSVLFTVPKIEFGQGFDGRKETSFRPADISKSTKSQHLGVYFEGC